MNDEFYWYWLCNINGIGNVKIKKLLEQFHTPKDLYEADEDRVRQSGVLTSSDIENFKNSRKDREIYLFHRAYPGT